MAAACLDQHLSCRLASTASSAPGLGGSSLCIIHFAFGTQSTQFQICGQMDGHSYANSLFPMQNVPEKHIFPNYPSGILNTQN